MFRRADEMRSREIEACHDGQGKLLCRTVLERGDSDLGIQFMHSAILEPGAIIGEHPHDASEEVYLVIEGKGIMILDGDRFPIGPGDVCLVESGHSHGIINAPETEMWLLVICVKNR